jgi:cellulose synthase/poly-beta-1,6-N-acetylglucosamine synthase-like glycosyltransferase
LTPADRLIVVADNCTDDTAQLALDAGAHVVERHDSTQMGKGYALDAAIEYLRADPPSVVVFIDADCAISPRAIRKLVTQVALTKRPAQGAYWMTPGANPRINDLISSLAVTVKNIARPAGLRVLGLPCLLTGTGMAFPWDVICDAKLATASIVEDMQLGLDLARKRTGAVFCPDARFEGQLPARRPAALQQRRRWEHGHLHTLISSAAPLFIRGLTTANPQAMAIALDVAVLPLALLTLLLVGAGVLGAGVYFVSGDPRPLILIVAGLALQTAAVLAAWAKFARNQIPITSLLAAPLYVLWKIPIYLRFIFHRQKKWVRTERDPAPAWPVETISKFES